MENIHEDIREDIREDIQSNPKCRILENISVVLSEYTSDQLLLVEDWMIKGYKMVLESRLKLVERRETHRKTIENIVTRFIEKYAFMFQINTYFVRREDEWLRISHDRLYEDWGEYLYGGGYEWRYYYDNRQKYFKMLKKSVREKNVLNEKPGKRLVGCVEEAFQFANLGEEELEYVYAFLGMCCRRSSIDLVNTHGFETMIHIWHGYKVYEILNMLHRKVGVNPYFKMIKHRLPGDYVDFSKVCCVHFPHRLPSRRQFFKNVMKLSH